MGKPLRCRVRLHKWVRTKNPDGEYYWHCARCNQVRMAYEGPAATSGGGAL
jgi:hypothetical protein